MIRNKTDFFYTKSDIFIILYVSAYFLNESERWESMYSSLFSLAFLILTIAAPKHRYVVFIFFLVMSSYFIFEKYPRVSNHSTLILFVNFYLFISLLSKLFTKTYKVIISNNDFIVLRWTLIIVYFFTGFHKLNYDFLFSDNSCANWYHTKLLFNITNNIIKPYPDFIYVISPFLVVVLEITESIGLMFRRTQLFALYSFILLHIYLSLGGFIDFAAVCISLMIAFIPAKNFQNYQHYFSQKIDILFVKIDRIYFYVMCVTCIGLIILIERTFNIIQTSNHRIIIFISGLLFIANLVFLSWYFLKKIFTDRIFVWESENLFYRIPFQAYSFIALLIFQGSQNYLGLSTAGTFSMFSNLRTEGGSSNHLILKDNPLEIFDFQKDLVYIETIKPPYYQLNYTTNNIKNRVIPRLVFEEYLYNLSQMNISNVDIILEYRNKKLLVKNILKNSNWTPNKLNFKHKYLYFRKIYLSNDVPCVW